MKGYQSMRLCTATVMLTFVIVLSAAWVQAQENAGMPVGRNIEEMKFVLFPGLPTCAPVSVQNGDPATGPSIIAAKVAAGCSFPWHWHTPNEHVMLMSGAAKVDTKDGQSFSLHAGGFVMLPSRHIHQFRAELPCVLYIYSDKAFDIHYVDDQGNEITAADALKKVNETTVTEIKPVEGAR